MHEILMLVLKVQKCGYSITRVFFKGGGVYPHLKSADPSQLTENCVSSEYGLRKQMTFGRETSGVAKCRLFSLGDL